MNAKDLDDVADVVYWLAAIRPDLEALQSGSAYLEPAAYIENALRCLGEAEAAIERVALGVNRGKAG